jgi:hypothetical protein
MIKFQNLFVRAKAGQRVAGYGDATGAPRDVRVRRQCAVYRLRRIAVRGGDRESRTASLP